MTSRLTPWLPSFLTGALVLCCGLALQSITLHLPLTPAGFFLPFWLGGLGGLLLGNRTLRIKELEQALVQSNKRMQELFTETGERYHQFFQLSQTVQLLIDPYSGSIVKSNEAALRYYGYSAEEFSRKSIFELNTAAPESIREALQQALDLKQHYFRFQHRLQSGETRAVDVHTLPLALQGRTLLHSVILDVTGYDQAESGLRRKTLEQRALLDAIPVSVWYLHDPETYGMVNKAFADCFDRQPKEIAHKKMATVLDQELLALALASNHRVFAEGTALHYHQWVHYGNHEPCYMALTKTPKLSETGEVDFVVCTATDITGMKQTKDLLQNERDLHLALNTTTSAAEILRICLETAIEVSQTDCGGLYLVDQTDGSLTLSTHQGLPDTFIQKASRYNGDSEHAHIVQRNQAIYTAYPDLALQAGHEILQEEGIRVLGIVPISFQGRVIACLNVASRQRGKISNFHRLAVERIAAHVGTFLVQKEQETQIRRHQQNFEALFNTIHDFVFILDMEGVIIHLNTAAASRLGYQPAELIGTNVLAVHPHDRREEVLEIVAAMLAGTRDHCPIPLITKTGELIPVETHVNQGQWSGQPVLFGLSRDISSRLQIERQQRLLLKSQGLERMAGAIAHHFNNLLTIVAGNLELAQEQVPPGSPASGFLTNARIGSKRAIELGQALLIYTGQFAEIVTPLNLSDFCREWLQSSQFALPGPVELTVDLASPGPMIAANPAHLQQTLSALMTNAQETLDRAAGRIVLRVRSMPREAIGTAHIFPAGWTPTQDRYGCLEISDTGTGIDEQDLVNIFDPFYSDKFIGRGLGLPLALSIVKKLNGAITVTSQPNQGSTFQVLLPEQNQSEHQALNND